MAREALAKEECEEDGLLGFSVARKGLDSGVLLEWTDMKVMGLTRFPYGASTEPRDSLRSVTKRPRQSRFQVINEFEA